MVMGKDELGDACGRVVLVLVVETLVGRGSNMYKAAGLILPRRLLGLPAYAAWPSRESGAANSLGALLSLPL
jgi:hypothetical protein